MVCCDFSSIDGINALKDDIQDVKFLTKEEDLIMLERIKKGDKDAKEIFCKSKLPMVLKIAKNFDVTKLSYLDLVQEGCIGLLKAIEKFDSRKSTFNTYAYALISSYIMKAIREKGDLIRIPHVFYDTLVKYFKACESLENTLGREASCEEIAEYMSVSVNDVIFFKTINPNPASIDAFAEEFGDYVLDKTDCYQDIYDKELVEVFKKLVIAANLDEREIDILKSRWGSEKKTTFKELGIKYGITWAGVQKIERLIFQKLLFCDAVFDLAAYRSDPERAISYVKEYRKEYYLSRSKK